jgi:hypothetical protein
MIKSHERSIKTRGLRISGPAWSNQSDLLAFFSRWKVNLKIGLNPGSEDDLPRMAKSRNMNTENGPIPEDDLPRMARSRKMTY